MYALPSQTLDEAAADLETALSFAPPHLSLYHLTMEPNTLFAKYPPRCRTTTPAPTCRT
jgi:coproporphyrinogen III oxidase-like Fe-S oxidoreductase